MRKLPLRLNPKLFFLYQKVMFEKILPISTVVCCLDLDLHVKHYFDANLITIATFDNWLVDEQEATETHLPYSSTSLPQIGSLDMSQWVCLRPMTLLSKSWQDNQRPCLRPLVSLPKFYVMWRMKVLIWGLWPWLWNSWFHVRLWVWLHHLIMFVLGTPWERWLNMPLTMTKSPKTWC